MANRRMKKDGYRKHHAAVPAHPKAIYGMTPKKPEPDDVPGKMRGGNAKARKKRLAGMMI